MGQEDAEKEISFDCLRVIVEDAIKAKNICTIEKIKDEHQLRYMQKYAEMLVSEDESSISSLSYSLGMQSFALAFCAIGLSYFLAGVSRYPLETINVISGSSLLILGFVLFFWIVPKREKENENMKKDIEFTHDIILKIEEKLPNRT